MSLSNGAYHAKFEHPVFVDVEFLMLCNFLSFIYLLITLVK